MGECGANARVGGGGVLSVRCFLKCFFQDREQDGVRAWVCDLKQIKIDGEWGGGGDAAFKTHTHTHTRTHTQQLSAIYHQNSVTTLVRGYVT